MKKINSKKLRRTISIALVFAMLSLAFIVTAIAIGSKTDQAPDLEIIATNLSFNDSVYIKYAVECENVDKIEDVKLLIWTSPSEEYLYGSENAIVYSSGRDLVNGTACIIFDYKGLSAKQITDYVYARAYYVSNGEEYYSDVKKYSILTYAYNKLGYTGSATENEDLASLLRGLLEYGASAQKYFNYKCDTLSTDTYVKVTLENGTFTDGFNTTLAIPGTKLTIKASEAKEGESFLYWADETGKILSNNENFEITVGNTNHTVCAVYAYNQGGNIEGAGSNLSTDSFALTEHNIDTSGAIEKTPSQLSIMFAPGLGKNAIYRVTGDEPLRITSSVRGNGAVIIAEKGVIIENQNGISIENLIIIGNVTIINSSNISFKSTEIQNTKDALLIDEFSSNITVDDCRIISDGTSLATSAFNTSIVNSYLRGKNAINTNEDETTVYNCYIQSDEIGIKSSAHDTAIYNNTILSTSHSNGILVDSESLNTLITFNKISGAQDSIKITEATNTVVLFNSCYNVNAENNVNTYIVENSLGGQLILTNNNYLLCDENTYLTNRASAPIMSGNSNINGNNLMDVDARNDLGAKEELLPHTNKELFLDMERKSTVKDVADGTVLDLNTYIENNAKTSSIVIVPPGAYLTAAGDVLSLGKEMSNTEIYAFGVYNEHDFNTDEEYLKGKGTNRILDVSSAENITIHGISLAYNYQSSGQVHVLKKLENQQILVVPAAGYDLEAGFGQSNPGVFSQTYTTKYDAGNLYSGIGGAGYTFVSRNDDGTLILKLTSLSSYDAIDVGDIITCRMAGSNQHTIGISNSKSIKLKDVILYGYSASLMTVVSGSTTDASLERVHNTARPPFVIDKETYDMYASLEKKYGVDLEIYVDDLGRYRGSIPRVGSVDATHVSGSSEGLDITSCLFENMCDDGSNQRGGSSRLAGIKDNGDGTTTLFFKGMVTSTYHGLYKQDGKTSVSLNPSGFSEGDMIYVYASNGKLLCDTVCLESAREEDDMAEIFDFETIRYYIFTKSVKVATDSVNFDAIEGYDLTDNHYSMKNKVLVDNISHCSEGFVIDNLMVRNSTARGVLIKTINATVKNSTFRNVTGTGNLLSVETSWGESTVARNATISACLFDNVGFSIDDPIRAPIAISGLSTYGEANVDTLRVSDIIITGCEFRNYGHQFAIYVNGAKNVKIIDNVFDPKTEAAPGNFIKILTALNVEVSGNKYKNKDGSFSTINNLDAEDYTHVYGSDVGDTYKAKCDIFVGNNHLSSMRIFYDNDANRNIASIMATNISDICGYSVSYSNFYKDKVIKLVALEQENETVSSNTYVITSDGNNLTITAPTRASLIYAVEDFTNYLNERSKNEQVITFDEGFILTRSFDLKANLSTDTNNFKYTGLWNVSGVSMTSLTDSDCVEFDITGNAFTLLFSETSEFELYIDNVKEGTYIVDNEMTFYVENGRHTIKVMCRDTASKLSFLGIKCLSASVSRTEDKLHYIQFIGDSMVDDNKSFAHTLGNTLGWDYSVMVGDSLPNFANTGRTPDIVFIFLGTDAIDLSASESDAIAFAQKYEKLVKDIIDKYGSSTQIHMMQVLSTSNPSAMFDTEHIRYKAVDLAMSYCKDLGTNIHTIDAETVKSWAIEFDPEKDATNPTDKGYDTLVINLAMYISKAAGYTDYYNHSFELSKMKNYNGKMQTGLVEDGISFSRYNFIDKNGNPINGHVFISGDDYANKIFTNSGRYLIFKFRSSADYGISFNLRTNDYGTNVAESGKGYVSTVTRSAVSLSTDWEIAVIDLAQFAHYTTDTNIGVQVRITTTASEIDIADVTIVDTISDANLYILSKLKDAEYTFYERWDMKGVRTSITGKEIIEEEEELIDLSYVNHNFNLLVMKMYNGTSITTPTEVFKCDEDGTVYNHFAFTRTGHIFFKGSNVLSPINGDTGNYLVIKYRASDDSYLALEMQTSDLPYNSSRPYDTMVRSIKQSQYIPDGWEVAVIDLSQFTSYERDSDYNVLIRITTVCSYVDISYIGLVDDITEAERFLKTMGDNEYVHYNNWASEGTAKTLN